MTHPISEKDYPMRHHTVDDHHYHATWRPQFSRDAEDHWPNELLDGIPVLRTPQRRCGEKDCGLPATYCKSGKKRSTFRCANHKPKTKTEEKALEKTLDQP